MADFIMAKTAREAVSLKNSGSAFLAGGTEINRLGSSVDCEKIICIGRLEMDGVSLCEDGTYIRIGALTTFQEAVENKLVPPYFKTACSYMANRTKRNMATIGGNVALRRDDSYLWAVLLASHAQLEIMTPDGSVQHICSNKYNNFHEDFADCLILAVLLHNDSRKVVSKRFANTAQSHSYLTVAACNEGKKTRLAATVKNSGIYRLHKLEELLSEGASEDEIMKQATENCQISITDDMFGSAAYKRYLLGVSVCTLVKEIR